MTSPDSWETLGDVVSEICSCSRKEVRIAIESKGFDGLYDPLGDCRCGVEDLFPCGEPSVECRLGVRAPCPKECGYHDFHIVSGTPGQITRMASDVVVGFSPSVGRPTCVYLSDGSKIVVRRDSGTVGAAWLEHVTQSTVCPSSDGIVDKHK